MLRSEITKLVSFLKQQISLSSNFASLDCDGFLLTKSYKLSPKKVQRSYISWHWRVMQSLKKHSCGLKYDKRNLLNFHPTTQKSENFFLMGYFCPKYAGFELQKYRGGIFYDTELWFKIWINYDLVVSKIASGIGWTFIRALKILRNCTLMVSFCPKHIIFQLKTFIGIMCHDTKGWCTT